MRPSKPIGIIAKALAGAPNITTIDTKTDVAVVESAIDIQQLTRSILQQHIALQDVDRREAAECKAEMAAFERYLDRRQKREATQREQDDRRARIGADLIELKKATKHGQWLPTLEKLGIEPRNAQRWMDIARDPGKQRQARWERDAERAAEIRHEPDVSHLPDEPKAKTEELEEFHFMVELGRARKSVEKIARKWPASSARSLVMLLRDFADDIERGVVQLLDEPIDEEGGAR